MCKGWIENAARAENYLREIWDQSLTDYFCQNDVNWKEYEIYQKVHDCEIKGNLIHLLYNFNRTVQSAIATDRGGPMEFMMSHNNKAQELLIVLSKAKSGRLFDKHLPSQGNGYKVIGKITRRTLRKEHFRYDELGRELKNSLPEKDYYVISSIVRGGRNLFVVDEYSDESKAGLRYIDEHFIKPKSFRPLESHEAYV